MAMIHIWRMPHHDGGMGGEPWRHNGYNDATATAMAMANAATAMATTTATTTMAKAGMALTLCRPAVLGGVHGCHSSIFFVFSIHYRRLRKLARLHLNCNARHGI
jgi:hypothetical protein